MPIEVICPGCNTRLRTPDGSAGKSAKCPKCGTSLRIPVGPMPVAPPTPQPPSMQPPAMQPPSMQPPSMQPPSGASGAVPPNAGGSVPPSGYPPAGYAPPGQWPSEHPISFGAPPGGFGQPPSGYGVPPGGYAAPPGEFGAPPSGYGVPPSGYPPAGYGVPGAMDFGAIPSGHPMGGGMGMVPPMPPAAGMDPMNPYAAPQAVGEFKPRRSSERERTGPSWERIGMGFGSYFSTMGELISSPNGFFDSLNRRGGLSRPTLYVVFPAMGLAIIGGLLLACVILGIGAIASSAASSAGNNSTKAPSALGMFGAIAGMGGVFIVVMIVFVPIIYTIYLYIGSGIHHLALLALGGAEQGFQTTLRVTAYVWGSVMPFMIFSAIPCLGSLVSLALMTGIVVFLSIGFARAHEIPGWKGALAALGPMLLLCGLYIGVFVISLMSQSPGGNSGFPGG